jgi:16S rRNA (cytidine1402-2'-O)-methyltransferase
MAGILSIVCTPIGNMGDLSPRAKQVLSDCNVVFAEDTRHSEALLRAAGIDLKRVKLISLNQQNELSRVEVVVERLERGDHIALISDAGAPAISDPGGRLIEEVAARGFQIQVVPGPSALVAALMGAGLNAHRFSFLGFLPKKGKVREQLVLDAAKTGGALVLFEAAIRVEETLKDLFALLGARRVVVARELTKLHETFHRGVLGALLEPAFVARGECVVVVEAGEGQEVRKPHRMGAANFSDATPKERAKILGELLGIETKVAYKLLTQLPGANGGEE